ncbi:ATP-binding cassette domain-containing protein [Hymenobacter cellulosivorans]|uniref:ATP-binding cassette domain-containing protein n=2 Tax=Hymenobacter cellulosivorans TaxID=2932249 RepID=A0ABY4F4U0_9BACT|nr:ABC-F family ATP-binding cassette domain-containing protein [Hymenobacter cellulosivorans]UOQ51684.1 ATP-binding cassette domain-containing protein [Hymenobacter cellulosivorans]
MLVLQNLSYSHPNQDVLFDGLQLALEPHHKSALVGNNGAGKSTLLRLLAGLLPPTAGRISTDSAPYYVPQHFGQYNHLTLAQALGVADKLTALHQILAGEATEAAMAVLDDDWTLEERCHEALAYWQLAALPLTQPLAELSGGQKTKVFLAGLNIHRPELVLLDEPSNHLDTAGRQLLYDYIQTTSSTLLVVSHDRQLLNLLDSVYELSPRGLTLYGGNYDFYAEQKQLENQALAQEVHSREKQLRKAREVARQALERKQKQDARGRKNQDKAGLPAIVLNTMRNNAENSTARLQGQHTEKTGQLAQELTDLRRELPAADKMKFGFDNSALHAGKVLVTAEAVNFTYPVGPPLWPQPLSLQIRSGERIALRGSNGAGKTTLIRLLLGPAAPTQGTVQRAACRAVYIDQDYSLLPAQGTLYELAQHFNQAAMPEHEVKIRLARFLFGKDTWDQPGQSLSGGEKMRLALCGLTLSQQAPDLIVLDEPTNNLDLQNIAILTAALNEYAGTLLVVSHDAAFLADIGVARTIAL